MADPDRPCFGMCDHCRPDIWHGCELPGGHPGVCTCSPDLAPRNVQEWLEEVRYG